MISGRRCPPQTAQTDSRRSLPIAHIPLVIVLSLLSGQAAEGQSSIPNYETAVRENRVQWLREGDSAAYEATCDSPSTLWARAGGSNHTLIWNKRNNRPRAEHDTFYVLFDTTRKNLSPQQVVRNHLLRVGAKDQVYNKFNVRLDSLTWQSVPNSWGPLSMPLGSVLLFNPSLDDLRGRSTQPQKLRLQHLAIAHLGRQDTLHFYAESPCAISDTLADVSTGEISETTDPDTLHKDLLDLVERWSGKYVGTGTRVYKEWVTDTGLSQGLAPWDTTSTTTYDTDNPIRMRIVLEDPTVMAVYLQAPGRTTIRRAFDLTSFIWDSAYEEYSGSGYESGTHLGPHSMALIMDLSLNSTDMLQINRLEEGGIQCSYLWGRHRDLFPYHSRETIESVVYPQGTDTHIYEREAERSLKRSHLYQNAPNPFNGSTLLRYALDREHRVQLSIYALSGQRITQLVHTGQTPGHYEVLWNGQDRTGRPVASGLYIARLQVDQFTETRKLLLVR